MIRKLFASLLCASLILGSTPYTITADSLWDQGRGTFYGTPKKDVQVGDTITILISESTSADQQATTKTSKEASIGTNFLSGWDQVANLLGNETNRKTYDFSLKGDDADKVMQDVGKPIASDRSMVSSGINPANLMICRMVI